MKLLTIVKMDTQSDVKNHVAVNNDRLDYTRNCTENEQSTSTNVSESCVPQHNQDVQISLCVTNDSKEGSDFNPTDDVVSDSVCFTSNTELELDQNNVCESSNDMDEEQNCEGDITSSVFTKSRSRKLRVIDSDSEEENEHEHQINKSDYQNEIQVCVWQLYELNYYNQIVFNFIYVPHKVKVKYPISKN